MLKALFFIFLTSPLLVFSQTRGYLPLEVGNEWYFDNGTSPLIRVLGDTTIAGKQYRSVYDAAIPFEPFQVVYLREDSNRVYRFDTSLGSELLLYDFGATAGDTLVDYGQGAILACDENQMVQYAGKTRREWSFARSTRNCPDCSYGEVIVDSIGWRECWTANHTLRLSRVVLSGNTIITSAPRPPRTGPQTFEIAVYPIPLNPTGTLRYKVPGTGSVKISLVTLLGQVVHTDVVEVRTEGVQYHIINGTFLASGVYFCRVEFGDLFATRRIIILK